MKHSYINRHNIINVVMAATLVVSISSIVFVSIARAQSCSYSFSRTLRIGSRGTDVMNLQKVLNMNSLTRISESGAGSPGNETSYFGSLTRAKVIKYQQLYAAEILTPLGLTYATGFVGPSTRAKLNATCNGDVTSHTTSVTTTNTTNTNNTTGITTTVVTTTSGTTDSPVITTPTINVPTTSGTTAVDTYAPSVPTGLTATAVSSNQINLTWNASADDVGVTGYNVYRDGALVVTLGNNITSFGNTNLTPSTAYSYTVQAIDAAGNASSQSAAANATIQTPADTTAPSIPTGLSASVVSSTQINLTWNASTDNVGVKGYYVYLNDAALDTTTSTSFQHTGLIAGNTYNYRVSAYDAVPNHSAWTATPVSMKTVANITTNSAKFIPTFLIYYGGGPDFTASDAAKLAKFDLIDTDRFRYDNIGSNTWTAIKAINPNVQIYLYEMGAETPGHLDSTAQVYLNGLGRYNVSRGHPQGSLNGNNPKLFQLDASGNRIYSKDYSNAATNKYWYLMDFGSSAYQSYWASAAKADIVDQVWRADGIFVDNCLTLSSGGGYSAVSQQYPTNVAWSGAMNSFVNAITAALHGYGQKVWCNRGETRTVDGSTAWKNLDNSASPPDVLLEEGVFAVQWGSGDVQFYQESEWKRQIDTLSAIKNSKVAMLSHTDLAEGQSGIDNSGKTVSFWQALWYSLGSFALAKNDTLNSSHFMFNGGSGYNKIWWYDEYDKINLGRALGPYTVTSIGGVNIYSREFEKGYVYVNPTTNDIASVALPQASRPLSHENLQSAISSIAVVNTISLKGHHSAILLKTTAEI